MEKTNAKDAEPRKINIAKIFPMEGSVLLDESGIHSGLVQKHHDMIHNPNLWHRINVLDRQYNQRDAILTTITNAVHPLDLIPVYFQIGRRGKKVHFLVRNCGPAILQLCRQNLRVANPTQKPFQLSINLGFSDTDKLTVNVQDNVIGVLKKRFDSATKVLDLEEFHKDTGLSEFCILSQPKILFFVLHLSKSLPYTTLKLSNNGIKLINPIHSIWGSRVSSLDLRNNMIESLTDLDNLKSMPITELWLEGNPLCDKYDEHTYIQAVKEICPKIVKLDGLALGQNGMPAFRRNFVCEMKAVDLVDQFLEHYFTLYDAGKRNLLEGLYDRKAMFSLVAHYIPGQISSPVAQLKKYTAISRNLKTMADISKANVFLQVGNTAIVKILSNLPPTEHDPFTFTVDLMFHKNKISVVTVSGVFKEPAQSLLAPERIFGFSRTFVLKAYLCGEYSIINDMLIVTNATSAQHSRAFKVTKVPRSNFVSLPPPQNDEEKKEMAEVFTQITTMNTNWSQKCLEECEYDMKKSLKLFVDLYKMDKIPGEAFNEVE